MYLKRSKIGKFWPIPRKGTKYLALATHNTKTSIPLVVVFRDILKIVRNKRELKRALNEKQILVNQREVIEVNYPISLFDIITLKKSNKSFKANLSETKKMIFEEVSGKDSETRIYKVINKKKLGENKFQINLSNGKNIISDEKINTKDSILLNLKTNKILKIITMEKGKEAFVMKGKHIGATGKIQSISMIGNKEIADILFNNKKINVWTKNLMILE
jgi:small subunit ribosomal protein S4e